MNAHLDDAIVLAATLIVGAILFLPRLRHARSWTATVTPLASIIGSGFLVLAPLLDKRFGVAAAPVMLALCAVAYLFGGAIRHNIAHSDGSERLPPAVVGLERMASIALAFAYVVSVTYYLNLFGSFGVALTPFDEPVYGRALATLALAFIALFGAWQGLSGLEGLETWVVSLKLAIIAGLLAGLGVYFAEKALDSALLHPPVSETGWPAVTLAFGMLITVQGFETSRYLGSEYSAEERIRSMRSTDALPPSPPRPASMMSTLCESVGTARIATTDCPSGATAPGRPVLPFVPVKVSVSAEALSVSVPTIASNAAQDTQRRDR
ncbi:MAG: hypothetical protein R3F21_14575 [Myxococcota bacterium]